MRLSIASGLLRQIIDHSERSPDREVCGLLLGDDRAIVASRPAANLAADTRTAFELDPAVQFAALRAARAGGPGVIGHYHSHPDGRSDPSPRDAAMAHPGELWMIVAAGEARLFRAATGGGFTPVTLDLR